MRVRKVCHWHSGTEPTSPSKRSGTKAPSSIVLIPFTSTATPSFWRCLLYSMFDLESRVSGCECQEGSQGERLMDMDA